MGLTKRDLPIDWEEYSLVNKTIFQHYSTVYWVLMLVPTKDLPTLYWQIHHLAAYSVLLHTECALWQLHYASTQTTKLMNVDELMNPK